MADAATGGLQASGGLTTAEGLPTAQQVFDRAPGENFSVASLVLGRDTRRHLLAIYGYARLVDEIGDAVAGDRLARLDAFEVDLDRLFAPGGEPAHPVLRNLQPSVRELDLPRGPFQRLIEANRRDQETVAYSTYEELVGYCDLSANPVGELVLHVFGAATADRIELSDRVCTALQLAEHWQDVAEDRVAGRVYLPAEDLERFGVGPDDLHPGTTRPKVRELLAFEVTRARALLDDGAPLVGRLNGRARIAVAGYVGGGRAALDEIAARDYDVLAAPPRAGKLRRARATAATYLRAC
jgi:squalene synthase HpnC